MPKYVAFLRAINVGGSHVVKMDRLRELFADMGFTKVTTFIASGNVIFETRGTNIAAIETKIEKALEAALGYEVVTFVRTLSEVAAIAKYQPFEAKAMASAAALNVGMLKAALPKATVAALMALRTEVDDFHVNGAHLYWICKEKQSQSKISNAVFERALKAKATFRGLRTMEKLMAQHS